MLLPADILMLFSSFAPLFSPSVWINAQALLTGALLAIGKRTVTSALRVCGLSHCAGFTNFHRVLNRATWSARLASRILLGLLLGLLDPDSPVVLAADDTIERRSARHIPACGSYRDPRQSSLKHTVACFGLRWLSLTLIVKLPFSSRPWALPFMTLLCWPRGSRKRHKTIIQLLIQAIKQVRRWLPDRQITLVVDGAFSAYDLADGCLKQRVRLVSRLRLDAGLYDKPGPVEAGRRGRRPVKGKRQRLLKDWAARNDTRWEQVNISWYGGASKQMLVVSRTALWYKAGKKPVEVRWVLARDPEGKLKDGAYFCTDTATTPAEILGIVVKRWSVEVTFEEARSHLGVETQRQWTAKAIRRTTPVLMGLYSIVALIAVRLHKEGKLKAEQTAWYKKGEPTFSDCIAEVRREIRRANYFQTSSAGAGEIKINRQALEVLIESLPLAA
jgi:hypothetical protein